MNQVVDAFGWLLEPSNWSGSRGIGVRIFEHLWYTLLAIVLAAVIAVPAGLFIGHTGKGRSIAIGLTGALRALPSLGLLTFLAVIMGLGIRLAIVPSTIVLAILAIPPLLAASYSGVEAVDGEVVDGARATGLNEWQIVSRVEVPLAGPLLVGGLRSAMLQVIATATLSAYLGLGGLGRFIFDGQAARDYTQMLGGAIVVIALALSIDGLILLAKKVLLPAGVDIALGTADAVKSKPRNGSPTSIH